jgi:hypothetical protein
LPVEAKHGHVKGVSDGDVDLLQGVNLVVYDVESLTYFCAGYGLSMDDMRKLVSDARRIGLPEQQVDLVRLFEDSMYEALEEIHRRPDLFDARPAEPGEDSYGPNSFGPVFVKQEPDQNHGTDARADADDEMTRWPWLRHKM